ncbi:hypothetical protein WNY78_13495 [Psychroserpens sp. AS72]|uniref:hypothetical protein n=1 Tax=Psychroserpens sp. AS72 TaxID=3135775 RepID=UPI0031737BC1
MKKSLLLIAIVTIVTVGTAQSGVGVMPVEQPISACAAAGCYDQVGVGQNYDYNNVYSASRAISFPETEANKQIINDFQTASIDVLGQSKVYLTRYNPISNQIEIKGEDDIIYNINRIKNVKITFTNTNESYKAVVYKNQFGQQMIDYFSIPNGNDLLLKRISYTYVKAKVAKTSYDKSKPSYYKERVNYFYVDNKDNLIALSTKRKDIKNLYKKNSDEILTYIKSQKIDDSKELDLLKLATYLKNIQSVNNQETRIVKSR